MLGNFGLEDELWLDVLQLQSINHDYRELAATISDPLDYAKVIEDEIFKWKTITKWVNQMGGGHPDNLKVKASYRMVLREILADEPFCFEAIFNPKATKVSDYCQVCPLFWLTGLDCYREGSFKERLCRPLNKGHGIFRPFTMAKLLFKIKMKTPIKEIEVIKDVSKASKST